MDEDEEEEFGKGAEDDVYGADDEKTVYGNGNGSRFSTRRSGPLKNHVRRRLQTQDSDLEKHGAANARFSELPSIDKKVCPRFSSWFYHLADLLGYYFSFWCLVLVVKEEC